jgi:hypothetical protein
VTLEGAGIVRVFDLDPEHGWIALEWAPAGASFRLYRASRAQADRHLPPRRGTQPLCGAAR